MPSKDELRKLIEAGHPCIVVATPEESHALDVARSALDAGAGDVTAWLWSAVRGLCRADLARSGAIANTENPAAAIMHVLQQAGPTALITLDLSAHLRDDHTRRAVRELIHHYESQGSRTPGVLIMIEHEADLPSSIAAGATTLDASLPDDAEIERILRKSLRSYHQNVSAVDVQVTQSQLEMLLRNLRGLTRGQVERVVLETVVDDRRFDPDDIATIIEAKRRIFAAAGVLEFVDAPTSLDDVGGMRALKSWLDQRRRAFEPEAAAFGIDPPRGVLMLGVQGTGKSMCAKAIATAWGRPLLKLDAGSLYNSYIGESEKRLRSALRQAEAMSPVILWIDEIEKAFAGAASRSNDGGTSRRMFATLLTWMNDHTAPVFLVATANDIDALPPELLRKGRFDEIFFVDLPSADVRRDIIAIHLRRRKRDPESFDLDRLAAASEGYSAAELEQAVVSALHATFNERSADGTPRELTTDDIVRAVEGSPPLSVTAKEKIDALRAWAVDRCVPAD